MTIDPTALSTQLILLAESEGFAADYLEQAIRLAGGQVLGPVRTCEEAAELLARARTLPGAAVVNLQLGGGAAAEVVATLAARAVPVLLVGKAGSAVPTGLAALPVLTKPFAAYQVVECLQTLTRPAAAPMPPLVTQAPAQR